MFKQTSLLLLVAALSASATFAANANNGHNNKNNHGKKDDFAPGSSDSVKEWKAEDYAKVKTAAVPFVVYLIDAEDKNHTRAKLFESKTVLEDNNFKTKLQSFQCYKLKTTDSDAKSWPAEWISRTKNGASLIFSSGDMVQVQIFDKATPKEDITAQNLIAAMDNILNYEKARKDAKAKAEVEAAKKTKLTSPAK